MLVSELIERLKKVSPDMEVLTRIDRNLFAAPTFVGPGHVGTIKVVPVVPGSEYDQRPVSRQLLPGYEWREPIHNQDEPEAIREIHFLIS